MLDPSAPPFVPGQAWGLAIVPELPAALLEHICSRVSCLATLARVSAGSTQLAAAAARSLRELWQRWEGFVARAEKISMFPGHAGNLSFNTRRAVDRAVAVFALSNAQSSALPASLDNRARYWAHARAAQLRLLTQSHDFGAARRLHMTKPEGWVMSWTPAPLPPPPCRAPLGSRFDDGGRPWRPHWRRYDDEGWTSEEEDWMSGGGDSSSDDWL